MTSQPGRNSIVGRGSHINPTNQFETVHCEEDAEHLDPTDAADRTRVPTVYLPDDSQSIVSKNTSPDLNFQYSLNPYRGCAHGCSYCYARTYHEYLGMSAGLDFETKVLFKPKAAELLRAWLDRRNWHCEPITFSGATDCYQPIEKEYQLTRRCLEVALAAYQPIAIITKNSLVLRDLDLLTQMAEHNLVRINISITTLDQRLTRIMEPRTSSPQARLHAMQTLAEHGIPTRAMLAPIIPGLTDTEIPALLNAVKSAGGHSAGSTILRLPGAVEEVFFEWLHRTHAEHASRVEARIRQIRAGKLNDTRFNTRMHGEGEMANQIRQTFQLFARKLELDGDTPELDTTQFRRPSDARQQRLF